VRRRRLPVEEVIWVVLGMALFRDREETIRSKTREGVEQELWGILLAYNLVRLEMERVAKAAKVEPTRISFVESLRLICDEWLWLSVTSPGAIPKRLASMRANLKRYILPPRRPKRLYPRAVTIKMSNYAPLAAPRRDADEVARPPGARPGGPLCSARPIGELVEDGDDAIDGVDLPRHPRRIQVAGGTCDAKAEDDLAPAIHGALDADGANPTAREEPLSGVEADRVDGPLHLPAEIGIVPRDDAAESMDGADGLDDVIEDT
jgi:hypothetical protein